MNSSSILSSPPQALLVDIFGTVVDWRLTVTEMLASRASATLNSPNTQLPAVLRETASTTDWAAVAQKWREAYYQFCATHESNNPADSDTAAQRNVPSSRNNFKTIDEHHRESLPETLATFGLTGLWSEQDLDELAMVWHYLAPWPDSCWGLALLQQKFITASLSNGNLSLLEDLARTAGLTFTHLFSGEMFRAYKPNPLVYRGAAQRLGLRTQQCALVAAHLGDLEAARRCGYRTIYVDRVGEESWPEERKVQAREWVDLWVDGCLHDGNDGFMQIARAFGIEDSSVVSK